MPDRIKSLCQLLLKRESTSERCKNVELTILTSSDLHIRQWLIDLQVASAILLY